MATEELVSLIRQEYRAAVQTPPASSPSPLEPLNACAGTAVARVTVRSSAASVIVKPIFLRGSTAAALTRLARCGDD
jgi:hypothetical protein